MTKKKRVETPFNLWLEKKMQRRGMNPAKLADSAGVNRSTVSRWFTMGRLPEVENMLPLINALDVHPDELFEAMGLRDSAVDRLSPAQKRIVHLMGKTEWNEDMVEALENAIRFIQGAQKKAGSDQSDD